MKNSKHAFTMIELIFVVIIIGILASMAVTKLGSMKNTADIANARADVAAIRSAIFSERQRSLVRGNTGGSLYIPKLSANFSTNPTTLFTGNGSRTLLTYGMKAGTGAGDWEMTADNNYTYHSDSKTTLFSYDATTGKFDCTPAPTNDCNATAN